MPRRAPPSPAPGATPPALGPAIPAQKLIELKSLVHRLPLAQQDELLIGLPFDRLRMDAISSALAHHPEAARAVAAALKSIQL